MTRADKTIQTLSRDRLESIVGPRTDRAGECWTWTGSKDRDGYGTFCLQVSYRDGKQKNAMLRAHRIAFFLANGFLPEHVCHTCDNPPCVRPDHLFDGTPASNFEDCVRKGRNSHGGSHGRARLSTTAVLDIREAYVAGRATQEELASEYSVSRSAISHVIAGNTWAHAHGNDDINGNAIRQQREHRMGRRGNAEKTHCPAGHEYDAENTSVTPRGHRRCRACGRIAARERRNAGGARCAA